MVVYPYLCSHEDPAKKTFPLNTQSYIRTSMKFSDFDAVTANNLNERAMTEFADSTRIHPGDIANHGMVGNVKVLRILGTVAEVVDRSGKHLKLQLSSLHLGPMEESVVENYEKHSAAAAKHDKFIEDGDTDVDTYKAAIKHHERAAKTAPDETLRKVHTRKAEQYFTKSKTTNEAFPYDVDHMNGAIHRNAPMVTDNVRVTTLDQWERAANSINSRLFDDNCEFISSGERKRVVNPSGDTIAIWDNVGQVGWFNSRGQRVRTIKESVDAAVLQVGDPVKIVGNVQGAGERATFVDAGINGAFIVVKMEDGSKHSYHSSNVEYDEGDDEEYYDESAKKPSDMTGCTCTACKKGKYQETSQHDDMDGVLHCTNCGKQVKRWNEKKAMKELAMPYSEFKDKKMWTSVARKAGHSVETASNGAKLHAYNKHGDKVGTYDTDADKGHLAGSSVNESVLTTVLNEYGQGYGRERWDTNTQGYQDREQGRMDQQGRDFRRAEMDQELAHERNNYAVNIDGRQWKVFYDKRRAENVARSIMNKYPNKKVSVHPTGAQISEAVGDRYADQLAAKLPSGLMDEDVVLDQAFEIASRELGQKRARYYFAYDEDFASDLVSAYFYNERSGRMQEAAKPKQQAAAPRNFVAKNAKMGGAGAHKDQKRAAKQGDQKHKGKLEEAEDGYAKVEKAIAQHKRTLKNKLATPANVAYAQKMIARGNAALKKETGDEAYKHFQGGKLDESALIEADLVEISKPLRDRYVNRAVSAHGGYNMARRNTQGKEQEYWARKEQNTKKGISRALSDERQAKDAAK
jgi:hypothetical protein